MKRVLHRRNRSSSAPSPTLLPDEIQGLVRKIIFPAGQDFQGHQLICICACHFPSPNTIAYDTLLPHVIASIDSYVTSEYTLVFFAGQAQHKPNLTWTLSAYQTLGRKYRKGIKKLYIVHSGTWTRIILEVAGRMVSPKFARKIKYVNKLSELAEYVPLTQINIPPAVYSCNRGNEEEIILPTPLYNPYSTQIFGKDLSRIMGDDGSNGLPRVIVEAAKYIRSDCITVQGLFRVSPPQHLVQFAVAAYNRGHPVDLHDYGPHVAASLVKNFLSMLPMPVFPAHIYPALNKFPTVPEAKRTEYIQMHVFDRLDPPVLILLDTVLRLLTDVASAEEYTKMTAYNLAAIISINFLHHPHDPRLDAQLSNPSQNGGAALILIHCITNYEDIFPDKPLPPPPMPPRPTLKRVVSEDEPRSAQYVQVPEKSLSTPLPSAEFPTTPSTKGKSKARFPKVGDGLVEELRRVYEERSRIVKSQEPSKKEGGINRAVGNRGGMGIGIGRVT